ncbi:hypothetical protein [uncultured Acidaminococcus sp.]|uniref:hypothetical protein n=1 Tax=uncultured Acidaminococcus sp. TaxID=352152 RepID=UPI00266F2396|nr:hypothetical protein [uncultured Acidaminococcus sp.]
MEKLYSVNQVARDFFSGQISAPSIYNLIAEKKAQCYPHWTTHLGSGKCID